MQFAELEVKLTPSVFGAKRLARGKENAVGPTLSGQNRSFRSLSGQENMPLRNN